MSAVSASVSVSDSRMGPVRIASLLVWLSCLYSCSLEIKTQDSKSTIQPPNERYKRLIPYMMFYLTGQTQASPSSYSYAPITNVPNKLENHQLIQNYFQGAQYQILPQHYLQDINSVYRRLPYLVASQQIEGDLQRDTYDQQQVIYKVAKPIVNKERHNLKSLQYFHNPYTGVPLEQYQLLKQQQSPKVFSVTHFKTLSRPTNSPAQIYSNENSVNEQAPLPRPKVLQNLRPTYIDAPQIQVPQQRVKYVLKYRPTYTAQKETTLSDYATPSEIPKPDVDKLTAHYYSQHKLLNYKNQADVSPTYEEEKPQRPANVDSNIHGLTQVLQTLQRDNALYQPRLPISMKAIYNYLDKNPNDNTLQNLEEENKEENDLTQNVPADDSEGGTPGKAGVDYPALSIVPHTKFSCKTQRYKGFFGDPDTNCQVWHYCDLNGGQASFLCPNGTLFSQQALTCDWWFNVRCDATAQLYVLNERLYKYILPMKPSFPEDYSGPEADNYIQLKYEEAEAKRKEKAKNQTATHMHENVPTDKQNPQVIDVNKQVTLEDFLTKKSIQIK